MNDDVRFYKGKYRVRILTESKGYWIVEALEAFDDDIQGKKVKVVKGERRIVAPNLLFTKEGLSPPVKEHTYELKMEKKLKRWVAEEEKKEDRTPQKD
jgi:hypothetical protein